MEQKPKKKRRVRKLGPRHILLGCVLFSCALLGIVLSQQTKLKEIKEKQAVLQVRRDQMLIEEQRVERMLEYVQTDEYLAQYARDKLGYVMPDDYKFFRQEGTEAANE